MNFLLSGYYGYNNAGDEAVLAAMLEHLSRAAARAGLSPGTQSTLFTVTAGDMAATAAMHGQSGNLRAIGRQDPQALITAIRDCDVFLSGGGSLLQDVTSLRNVVYYTALLRMAQLARKPSMFYAQGVGPLRHSSSRVLARAAVSHARVITVRDEASRDLLQEIGVHRKIEVTADPVWDLTSRNPEPGTRNSNTWLLALRSWPGADEEESRTQSTRLIAALRAAASEAGATLRFLPLQPERDRPWMEQGQAQAHEIIDTSGWHPRRFVEESARAGLVIAIRLHALIFAASQSTPCVAINYDPKVEALARLIDAPLIGDLSEAELKKLPAAIAAARPLGQAKLKQLQDKARYNAQMAIELALQNPAHATHHSSLC